MKLEIKTQHTNTEVFYWVYNKNEVVLSGSIDKCKSHNNNINHLILDEVEYRMKKDGVEYTFID